MPTPDDPFRKAFQSGEMFTSRLRSETEYFNRESAIKNHEEFARECFREFHNNSLKPGIHLEVGFGLYPFDSDHSQALPSHTYTAESPYVGIDGGTSNYRVPEIQGWLSHIYPVRKGLLYRTLREAKQLREEREDGEFIHFLVADGRRLPLEDESVQSVYLKDVWITPGVVARDMYNMLTEFQRVMKPGGLLTVIEREASPEMPAWGVVDEETSNFVALGRAMEATGFRERTVVPPSYGLESYVFGRKSAENEPRGRRLRKGWLKNIAGF